jgi:hypothetical protein
VRGLRVRRAILPLAGTQLAELALGSAASRVFLREEAVETSQQEETLKWTAPAMAADTPPLNDLLTLGFLAEISKPLSCGRHC